MLEPDGHSYRCRWLEDSLTVHSDGNVSCGLDDPHAIRSFWHRITQNSPRDICELEFSNLQRKLSQGYRCRDCSLYERCNSSPENSERRSLPATLIIETTVKCNLRCPNAACIPNNLSKFRTRDRDMLDVSSFNRVVDEVSQDLRKVYFFNYGDPFVHKKAEDMLAYLRQRAPGVEVITITNGIPLADRTRAERVVATGLDHIVFTISGVDQESYEKYHVKGQVKLALQGLENVCCAKSSSGQVAPNIIWRYLLFRWNDSESELDRANNES